MSDVTHTTTSGPTAPSGRTLALMTSSQTPGSPTPKSPFTAPTPISQTRRQVRKERERAERATVITAAEPAYDEQLRARQKRYFITMSMRIPLLLLSIGLWALGVPVWVVLIVAAASIPLPWMAVLMANDRAPRTARPVPKPVVNDQRALPPARREIVDSD